VVWDHVGIHGAAALFTGGNRFDNNIAAMPSLHAAYPMLLLLFFWKRAHRPLRALLVTYVLAMAFTLVYTGEHFVLDEVVGWSYAIFIYLVGSHVLDRLAARRAAKRQSGHDRAEPASP
jgi:membrane-associated phospholipid phosphatase